MVQEHIFFRCILLRGDRGRVYQEGELMPGTFSVGHQKKWCEEKGKTDFMTVF